MRKTEEIQKLNNSPIATKARLAVNRAVRNGLLPNVSQCICVFCGNEAHVYHHHSYDPADWLNVDPLCGSCHKLMHLFGLGAFVDRRIEISNARIRADKRDLLYEQRPVWKTYHKNAIGRAEDDIECLQYLEAS